MENADRQEASKRELVVKAGISKSTLVQLNHDESVTLETIVKICTTLDCGIEDIVEIRKS